MNRRYRQISWSITAFALLLTVAASAAHPSGDEQLLKRIGAIAAETLEQPGAVGLSIAVARGSDIIHAEGYGYADLEHQVPMSEHAMLRIGSITKQYTAALTLKLAEEGLLSLDDPFTKYVEYPVGEHTVTIRHLLNHTSGIHSYTSVEDFWTTHVSRDLSDDELLALVRDQPFDFTPGEKFLYNNTGYYLLGMVIEKVTGETYGEAVRTRLLEPLGLSETRYDVNAEIVPHRARGYTTGADGIANGVLIGMRNPGAAGGLIATATNLVRWQQHLVAGQIVSSESFSLMTAPTILSDERSEPYGFGLALVDHHDRPCISHGGGINGFSSMLMYFPDDDLHIAVISNSDVLAAGRPAMRIAGVLFGIEESTLKDLTVSSEILDRIAGTYVVEPIGLQIRFWGDEGKLVAQASGQPQVALMYQGDGEFRASFDPSLRMTFALDPSDESTGPIEVFTLEQSGMTFTAPRLKDANE